MRICLLNPLPDPTRWSMKLYSKKLYESLSRRLPGDETITSFPPPQSPFWESDLNTRRGKMRRYLQQYLLYGLKLQSIKADIYHITDHAYAHLIPFLKGKKVIVTFHDALLPNLAAGTIPVSYASKKTIWAQQYSISCLNQADQIIAVSEFSKNELCKFSKKPLSSSKIITIHEGVDSQFLQPQPSDDVIRFKRELDTKGKTVLICGRIDPHKNMEGSLRILHETQKLLAQPITILKTGSDFTPSQKSLLQQFGLMPHYRYLGSVPEAKLPLIYQASDALLFVSFYEGFGFPALEAMASGTPVLLSNCSSLPEIGGDCASFADPKNHKEAALKLHALLTDDNLRSERIRKGKLRVAEFTWDKTSERTLEIYRKVFSRSLQL